MRKKNLMNQNDYCYACVAVSSTGQEHICGFSRTFAGLNNIKEDYIGACKDEKIEGMSFSAPERWSRQNIIDFFTDLNKKNVKWSYLFHGFITGEDKMYLDTPNDIDLFLGLKELYTDEID